jgi:hypothetical protein
LSAPRPNRNILVLTACSVRLAIGVTKLIQPLKTLIEALPARSVLRSFALDWIKQLGEKPYEEDPVSAKARRDLAAESELSAKAYPAELVKRLIVIGCAAE